MTKPTVFGWLALSILVSCTARPTADGAAVVPVRSASAEPSEPPRAAGGVTESCTRTFGTDAELAAAPAATTTTIADLLAQKPAAGRFTIVGYAQKPHHCPPGADCKPCEDSIWLSDSPGAGIKQPLTPEHDLRVVVHDGSRFQIRSRYRITVAACGRADHGGAVREYELRGYAPLP
jgi:hypothetical protein